MPAKPHILFVCGRNQWRSPTAARIYGNDQRIEVRSAGVSPQSIHRASQRDLEWADLVLVMETEHKARLREIFKDMQLPPIDSLDIPDDYGYMDPELVTLIREGTEFHLVTRLGIGSNGLIT
jgi:protein-tyrosine phosphatase